MRNTVLAILFISLFISPLPSFSQLGENEDSHQDIIGQGGRNAPINVDHSNRSEGKRRVRHSHEEQTDTSKGQGQSSDANKAPTSEYPTQEDADNVVNLLNIALNPPKFSPIKEPMIAKLAGAASIIYRNYKFGTAVGVLHDVTIKTFRTRLEVPLGTTQRILVRVTPVGGVTVSKVPPDEQRPLKPGNDLWYYQDIDKTEVWRLGDGTPMPDELRRKIEQEAVDVCLPVLLDEKKRQLAILESINKKEPPPPSPPNPPLVTKPPGRYSPIIE